MVYQDNSGCNTTFYKVRSKHLWFSMSLRIHKHSKSSKVAVNLSLNSAHFIAHVWFWKLNYTFRWWIGGKNVIHMSILLEKS